MSNHVGSSTIYTTILPNNAALARLRPVALSREAKHRLTIIEHYLKQPGRRMMSRNAEPFALVALPQVQLLVRRSGENL